MLVTIQEINSKPVDKYAVDKRSFDKTVLSIKVILIKVFCRKKSCQNCLLNVLDKHHTGDQITFGKCHVSLNAINKNPVNKQIVDEKSDNHKCGKLKFFKQK